MQQSPRAMTVSQLTLLVRGAIAGVPELEDLLIEGEVSNLRMPGSGHIYFTLKDRNASVRCVAFRREAARIPFHPQNGMVVVAHGRVDVYEVDGVRGRRRLSALRRSPRARGCRRTGAGAAADRDAAARRRPVRGVTQTAAAAAAATRRGGDVVDWRCGARCDHRDPPPWPRCRWRCGGADPGAG